jgi:hypothetical protein
MNEDIAAIINYKGGRKVTISVLDYPEEWHEHDNGLNVYARIIRWSPLRKVDTYEHLDPTVLFAISWSEVLDRVREYLEHKKNITVEFPNGVSKPVIAALGQQDFFVEAVKQVLKEIAKAHGFGDIPIMISEFPFDAFWD